jgi:hypothetical protein
VITFAIAAIRCTVAVVTVVFLRTTTATDCRVFAVSGTVTKLLTGETAQRVWYIYLYLKVDIPCLYFWRQGGSGETEKVSICFDCFSILIDGKTFY